MAVGNERFTSVSQGNLASYVSQSIDIDATAETAAATPPVFYSKQHAKAIHRATLHVTTAFGTVTTGQGSINIGIVGNLTKYAEFNLEAGLAVGLAVGDHNIPLTENDIAADTAVVVTHIDQAGTVAGVGYVILEIGTPSQDE